MSKSKHSQTAIEFMIIIGFLLFAFTVFFLAIQISTADKIKEEQIRSVKEIIMGVQEEINLAFESRDGYYREFKIPINVNGIEYNIQIVENLVYLNTSDGKNAIALPIQNVIGDVLIPDNFIKKEEGIIKLNVV